MPTTRSGRGTVPVTGSPIPTSNRFSPLDDPGPSSESSSTSTHLLPPDHSETPPIASDLPPPASDSPPPHPDSLVVLCFPDRDSDATAIPDLGSAARARAIHALVGDVQELRVLRSGCLRIVTRSPSQVESLLLCTSIAGLPVRFRRPRGLGVGRLGVISGISPAVGPDELSSYLAPLGVSDPVRLRRRLDDGSFAATWSIRATFPGSLPSHVTLHYERLPVRPFVRRPIRCYHCHRFGHGAANCRSSARCGRCGAPHATSDCSSPTPCCPSCRGPHAAWASDCPFFLHAKQVEGLRSTGLTYADALRQLPPPRRSSFVPPAAAPVSAASDAGPPIISSPPRSTSIFCTADAQTSTDPIRSTSVACSTVTPDTADAQIETDPDLTFVLDVPVETALHELDNGDEVAVFSRVDLCSFVDKVFSIRLEKQAANQSITLIELTNLAVTAYFCCSD